MLATARPSCYYISVAEGVGLINRGMQQLVLVAVSFLPCFSHHLMTYVYTAYMSLCPAHIHDIVRYTCGQRSICRGVEGEGKREGEGRTPHCFLDKSNPACGPAQKATTVDEVNFGDV